MCKMQSLARVMVPCLVAVARNQPDKNRLRKQRFLLLLGSRYISETSQWPELESGGHIAFIARKKRAINACVWVSSLYLVRDLSPKNGMPSH